MKKSGKSWWSQWRKKGYRRSWESSMSSGNSGRGKARKLDGIRESSMLTGTGEEEGPGNYSEVRI